MADIRSYVDTCLTKFVMGEKDMEAGWDGCFVAQLEATGIERASGIQAAKFER